MPTPRLRPLFNKVASILKPHVLDEFGIKLFAARKGIFPASNRRAGIFLGWSIPAAPDPKRSKSGTATLPRSQFAACAATGASCKIAITGMAEIAFFAREKAASSATLALAEFTQISGVSVTPE